MGLRWAVVRSVVLAALPAAAVLASAAPTGGRSWTRVSVSAAGGVPDQASFEPAVTPNGRFVAFYSSASDLLSFPSGGSSKVVVRDMRRGRTALASHTPAGGEGNGGSSDPALSSNGRFVVFQSTASDLVDGDLAGHEDIFLSDMRSGVVSRVSTGFDGSEADGESYVYGATISGNGRWVVFTSNATNLVDGVDTHGYYQVYLRDVRKGTTTLVSRSTGGSGAGGSCFYPSISPNGRFVVYYANAGDIVAGGSNGKFHIYLFDAKAGTSARVSIGLMGAIGDGDSYFPVVSNNGRFVAYDSNATNLVAGDVDVAMDAFLADRETGATVLLGRVGDTYQPSIAANGKSVVFYSDDPNLVAGDGNGTGDTYRYDAVDGTIERLSVDAAGVEGDGDTYTFGPSLASNGRFVAVTTNATNLADDGLVDGNGTYDVFLLRIR